MENFKYPQKVPENMQKSAQPILVQRFLDIREDPKLDPKIEELKPVFDNDEYRKHIFFEAQKSFEAIFKKEEFLEHLYREPNEDSRLYLRQIRRYGLVLRAMYQFMDDSHQCPEDFHQFLSLLGKVNDKYLKSKSEGKKERISDSVEKMDLPITFVDSSNFKSHVALVIQEIESLIEKKHLDFEELHTLRKKIRLFADLLQVSAAENYKSSLHGLFYLIIEISTNVDADLKSIREKHLTKPGATLVEVRNEIISEFVKVKPFIEKICGIS